MKPRMLDNDLFLKQARAALNLDKYSCFISKL